MWLVNNAGFVKGVDKVGTIDEQEIDEMIATNVRKFSFEFFSNF